MDNHSPAAAEEAANKSSARKYWWLLMLLPIGLIVGTVTSLTQALRKDKEEQEQKQYQIAVELNAEDIRTGMERALLIGERSMHSEIGRENIRTTRRFIQGVVSPAGTGLQFTKVKSTNVDEKTVYQTYVDIPGREPEKIIAILIEMEGEKNKGNAAKLAIIPSVIRSLAEYKPRYTLRFVLAPEKKDSQDHFTDISIQLLSPKDQLLALITLREKDKVSIQEDNDWTLQTGNQALLNYMQGKAEISIDTPTTLTADITHPALHTEQVETITDPQVKATLTAASQLRDMLMQVGR